MFRIIPNLEITHVLLAYVFLISLANCFIPSANDSGKWTNELEKAKNEFNLDAHTHQWMEKCEKTNGTKAVDDIRESFQNLTDCVTSRVTVANISDEIKIASPKGILDEVFAKYCNQVPAIKECSAPVFSALQVCVTEQSGQDLKIFNSAIDEALDFICFKGGERIAIFMSENGTDCFMSKVDHIATCLNGSLTEVGDIFMSMQNSSSSIFSDKSCSLETTMKACVIDSLKTCSDPTPANVIEGLIDSMIKKTPCYKSGSSNLANATSFTWMLAALAVVHRFMFQS